MFIASESSYSVHQTTFRVFVNTVRKPGMLYARNVDGFVTIIKHRTDVNFYCLRVNVKWYLTYT